MAMIKNHLSRLMGERKINVAELSRQTGLSKPGLHKIYHEKSEGISYEVLIKLCEFFDCGVNDILEYVPYDK